MGNYFSTSPLDYGAGAISNAGNNAAGLINGYAQQRDAKKAAIEQTMLNAAIAAKAQKTGNAATTGQIQLRGQIEAKARQDAIQQELDNQAISRWQAVKGNTPLPMVKGADGMERPDRAVINGMLPALETAQTADKSAAVFKATNSVKKQAEDAEWDAGHPAIGAPMGMADEERRVWQKQQADVNKVSAEAGARAKATDPYNDNYTQGDNMAIGGKNIGRAVRDKRTGEYGIMKNGKLEPIPEGATPITATALNKDVVNSSDFRKYREGLTDSERSLRQFGRYADSIENIQTGLAGLGDAAMGKIKTLLANGPLTEEQIARLSATGQLQGLLGGNRVSVVGGGVMTETDALRILNRLGGDVGALQNKEVVMKALQELYHDRYEQYNDDYNFHNEAVDSYWGSKGFKAAKQVEYDPRFAEQTPQHTPVAAPLAQPAQPASGQAAAPAIDDLIAKWTKPKQP